MPVLRGLLPLVLLVAAPAAAGAQNASGGPEPLRWEPISMAAIARANAKVERVFIERSVTSDTIGGGDWVSYLAARLGALPIPDTTGIRVVVDTHRIVVRGRVVDLPAETRALFWPLQFFSDTTTTLEAEVVMAPTGPGAVRFVLTTIRVNGIAIPETVLSIFLAGVGRQYPVLTKTGRELLVGVPPDGGRVTLLRNGVRVWIDPAAIPPPPPSPPGSPRAGW